MTSYHEHPGDTGYLPRPHYPGADQGYDDEMAMDMSTLSMDTEPQNVAGAGQESSSGSAQAANENNPRPGEDHYQCSTCGKFFDRQHKLTYGFSFVGI